MTGNPGVYKITNLINGNFYIGSSKNISIRWYHHKRNAALGSNKSPHLYSAMRKYGIDNFICVPILMCETTDLEMYEQQFLNMYVGLNECYNVSRDATAPMRRMSNETREKLSKSISIATKGRSPWNKGIPRTEEEKLRISEKTKLAMSKLTLSVSEETKEKLSKSLKGRKFSKQTKEKMSIAKIGKSPWNKGKPHTKSQKLTTDQVLSIRSKYEYGIYGIARLAKEYNVSPRTIEAIIKRRTWNHV